MNPDDRNYLEEALRILRGQSLLQPQVEHLQALNESRIYWRTSSLGHHARVVPEPARPALQEAV
jgi:hypothetical protein